MLQSFIGTCDSLGLRSLRAEDDVVPRSVASTNTVSFWAILDSEELPTIHTALWLGDRRTAFELLTRRAKTLGRLCS